MSAGHRRNRKGEGLRLRDDLLDAVTDLLARSGDAGAVTIRSVAARAGVSPPAVYLHFSDRDSLLRTAIGRWFDRRDPLVVTVQLWTALHGLVDLPITKPEIPWPDPHIATDDLVHRLGLAPDTR